MESFLEQVAADLHGRYGDGVSSLHAVFPSRRASLFFSEALAGIISRPIWMPASLTVDDIARELSGLVVGDRLRLVTELFKVYTGFHPTESFDTFYFWGELLLGDFEAIDKYLIDADTLFSNLVDLHELDDRFDYLTPEQKGAIERFWGTLSLSTPEQRDFLTVWRTLGPVYHRFRERLRRLGVATQGMVYREAAERITQGRAPHIPDRHYVIAGFNALSRSEQVMFDYLRTNFKTDFYWDYDNYFVRDKHQEAGMFMRDNLRRFPPAGTLRGGHDNFEKPKTIRSVAAGSDILQCKRAGLALADIARRTGRPPGRETAVVLCDESLLSPLLWSMPDDVRGINITMGYPLRNHPAYTFIERLIELQNRRRDGRRSEGRRRDTGREDRRSVAFYHSDVEGLLRHPYLGGHGRSDAGSAAGGNNFVYISASRLHTSPLFEKIFAVPGSSPDRSGGSDGSESSGNYGSPGDDWRALSDWLIEVVSEVARLTLETGVPGGGGGSDNNGTGTGTGMGERAGFFAIIVEHIRRLTNSLSGCGIELSTKTYARLLRRSLQSVTVPFEGEPLEGVQVMGILETRALDFENVIFLSAGDANMPGNLVGAPSFIPYNLKAAYGLPTPEHHEGVYSYHFFRLIQRARRVEMLWSRTADERSSGAPSRYILQLDYESPHTVEKESISVDVNLPPTETIVIEKDAEVMARLEEFLRTDDKRRSLSPSLFFTYTECPLKFWFRGVARLRPVEEVSEDVDGALLGNILHRAMQLLYSPLVGMYDPGKRIGALVGSGEVERAVTAAVTELWPGEEGAGPEDWSGAIVLARKTIIDYINRGILPYDASLPGGFTIESLEECIETEVAFGDRTVLFSGIADRIDRLGDGTLRVVDYKTGNPSNNTSALLQMGLYAMMAGDAAPSPAVGDKETPESSSAAGGARKVDPALYYVRDMSRPDYTPPPVEQGEEFEETLRASLTELFDPAVPFTQCADPKPCEWCDFAPVCRR